MQSTTHPYNTKFSSSSRGSDHSDDSQSTAPTSTYSRPSLQHAATDRPRYTTAFESSIDDGLSPATTFYPRSSTETYTSTIASQELLYEEPEDVDPDFYVPEYSQKEPVEHDLRPSTPTDFAELFPSTRRLYIRHDDTTYDGNMNLRVDTETGSGSKKQSIQLFHMRMHDLKSREFSLRRYCRDSGREVCSSRRKYAKPAAERPGIQRSVSNALANLRSKPELKRTGTGMSNKSSKSAKSTKRQDSGYGSNEDEFDEDVSSFMSEKKAKAAALIPTNTTQLEFSNYAHIDVKRRGAQAKKRYEFEYWGYTYNWKRVTEKDGEGKAVSYHLFKGESNNAVAHIVPELRSPRQMRDEHDAGGWVPPCSMWISDEKIVKTPTDVADVIIATGLIALIDDCIKRQFHSKPKTVHHVSLPLTPLKMEMEFIGPRAMVEHMFKRRNSGGSTKEREYQKPSPLRYASPVEAF
ncbi:hypothetical protein BP5796_05296 [Coleophoma crateriformis]|uniref:Uncharacterized protein n=1 Tax=Coleophoma crateriformis TaxID=565419 RepID=A0A3D8S2V5_9HELO|nr:hypothetical protein BP5796_05296 [Coleophoma crateriformis]